MKSDGICFSEDKSARISDSIRFDQIQLSCSTDQAQEINWANALTQMSTLSIGFRPHAQLTESYCGNFLLSYFYFIPCLIRELFLIFLNQGQIVSYFIYKVLFAKKQSYSILILQSSPLCSCLCLLPLIKEFSEFLPMMVPSMILSVPQCWNPSLDSVNFIGD